MRKKKIGAAVASNHSHRTAIMTGVINNYEHRSHKSSLSEPELDLRWIDRIIVRQVTPVNRVFCYCRTAGKVRDSPK